MPLPSQLDAASIQRLLGQLPPPTPQGYAPAPHQQSGQPPLPLPTTADLARLLASAERQTPQALQHQAYAVPPSPLPTTYPPPQQQSNAQNNANAYQSLLSNPALAALLKGSAPPTPQQSQYSGQQQQQQQQHNGAGVQQGQDMNMQNIMAKLARYG